MSSLYAKLIQVIEKKITPMAGAVGQQKYVTSIRDGFITALPFMIVGSFMLVFIFPPFSPDTSWGFARAWLQFSLDHREALYPAYLRSGFLGPLPANWWCWLDAAAGFPFAAQQSHPFADYWANGRGTRGV